MENKGLCSTCVHDSNCTFARKFPVFYCEEFTTKKAKTDRGKFGKTARENSRLKKQWHRNKAKRKEAKDYLWDERKGKFYFSR